MTMLDDPADAGAGLRSSAPDDTADPALLAAAKTELLTQSCSPNKTTERSTTKHGELPSATAMGMMKPSSPFGLDGALPGRRLHIDPGGDARWAASDTRHDEYHVGEDFPTHGPSSQPFRSVSRPEEVDRMATPSPPRTLGISVDFGDAKSGFDDALDADNGALAVGPNLRLNAEGPGSTPASSTFHAGCILRPRGSRRRARSSFAARHRHRRRGTPSRVTQFGQQVRHRICHCHCSGFPFVRPGFCSAVTRMPTSVGSGPAGRPPDRVRTTWPRRTEGNPERLEQRATLFVVLRGDRHSDIDAAHVVDLVLVDLVEHGLLREAERGQLPRPSNCLSDRLEVTDTGKRERRDGR